MDMRRLRDNIGDLWSAEWVRHSITIVDREYNSKCNDGQAGIVIFASHI